MQLYLLTALTASEDMANAGVGKLLMIVELAMTGPAKRLSKSELENVDRGKTIEQHVRWLRRAIMADVRREFPKGRHARTLSRVGHRYYS